MGRREGKKKPARETDWGSRRRPETRFIVFDGADEFKREGARYVSLWEYLRRRRLEKTAVP